MDNPGTLATLVTQDTGLRQTIQINTTQKTRKMSNTQSNTKTELSTDDREGYAILAAHRTFAMLHMLQMLLDTTMCSNNTNKA